MLIIIYIFNAAKYIIRNKKYFPYSIRKDYIHNF